METKSIEEIKKSYADEIHRLAGLEQQMSEQYKSEYESLKSQETKLLNEYNTQMQKIGIGIERLRGAYTALVDFEEGKVPSLVENGMLKDVKIEDNKVETNIENNKEELVKEQSKESKEPEPQLAKPHKNTGSEVSSEISKELQEKAHELVKEAKEKGKVTKYEDFAKSDLGKETALTPDEVEALKSVVDSENEIKPTEIELTKPVETESKEQESKQVKEEDVPDYLKEEYGFDKK